MKTIKKVVIIGPESTGKSTLAGQLADYYHTVWCPEFAREYLEKNGKNYTYTDLLEIAKGQVALEEKKLAEAQNGLYFIDTDMHVMKVWCEVAFGDCHSWILDQLALRSYDLYLLCNTDLPWVADELREYPDYEMRHRLFNMYKQAMLDQTTPWVEISGNDDERLKKAIEAVHQMLQ